MTSVATIRLGLLLLPLAGCVANPWSKSGASRQDFYMAQDQCRAQAISSPQGAVDRSKFDHCMHLMGWNKAND